MSKKFYILVASFIITASVFAQAPEKMSYQAVVRDADNALVTNQEIGMQIIILQGATAVYVETQTPTTNANGWPCTHASPHQLCVPQLDQTG